MLPRTALPAAYPAAAQAPAQYWALAVADARSAAAAVVANKDLRRVVDNTFIEVFLKRPGWMDCKLVRQYKLSIRIKIY